MLSMFSHHNLTDKDNKIKELEEDNHLLEQQNEFLQEQVSEFINPTQHIILGKLLDKRDDGVCLYKSSARKICRNVETWSWNRAIDEDHISSLEQIILSKECLEGTMDLLFDGENFCIVNGQHRHKAYCNIIDEDVHFDQDIYVNVHPVSSFDSDQANNVFTSTNNIKNVEMKDNPEIKIQNVCRRLHDAFPKGITKNQGGKATLWRKDVKELYNLFQYNDEFNDPQNSENYLYDKIIELNLLESKKGVKEFFPSMRKGKSKENEKRMKKYNGATDSGFFLGMLSENQLAITLVKHMNVS